MFSDAIKKMALRQLFEWMQAEKISEVKIFPDTETGEIKLENAKHPARFIHTDEIDRELEKYRLEFQRLRELIRQKDEEIQSLTAQIGHLKNQSNDK